ncbi:MAG: hypothetical protein DYH18_00625 [Xanthomonadales bacterium PRO7]|nr:hypothetical protein [Xanthomonadales bacterium PRO7]
MPRKQITQDAPSVPPTFTFWGESMVTAILYTVIALAVAIAIGAGILMISTKLGGGFMPKFLKAAITTIVQFIAAGVVSYILHMVLGTGGLSSLVSLVVIFLLYAAITNALLKKPDGGQMGMGRACLVTLIQIIIEIILGVILVFVFGAALFGTFAAMAG